MSERLNFDGYLEQEPDPIEYDVRLPDDPRIQEIEDSVQDDLRQGEER